MLPSSAEKPHGFLSEREKGIRGENLLIENYHTPVFKSPKLSCDIIRLNDGAKMEVKSDYKHMKDTPNFFVERWADASCTKDGGPWRAKRSRIAIFIYFFPLDGIYFEFDTKDFCRIADTYIKETCPPIKTVSSTEWGKDWKIKGYIIPREIFSSIGKTYEIGGRL
jgi:hypothetical protein